MVLKTIDLPNLGPKQQGKVRDFYIAGSQRITITTDRQSAFDVVLGHIPYKGAVLNMLAAFWFEKTRKIVPNHLIAVPDPNVLISKNAQAIPIEMIVRGYISGVTKTSIWYSYDKGERQIYGLNFPDDLKKNQKLPKPVITPTTHGGGAGGHDERLTREEILKRQLVPKKLYEQMEQASLALFEFGSKLCQKNGLILVDTKYEFGLDQKGDLMLIDEIHTPDSSRFWIADSYKELFKRGEEPENFDKEFLRLWYADRGYKGDGKPPKMSQQLITDLSKRYIAVYEKITGQKFKKFEYPIESRIKKAITSYMGTTNKLQICKQTRKIAADALSKVLKDVLASKEPISEAKFRDLWLFEMRKSPEIFPDGWYTPPPHGIIVLFADSKNTSRSHFQTCRPPEFWPRDDIFLDKKDGLLLLYSSAIDKNSGIIGDFELTLYLGKNKKIKEYIKTCYSLNFKIFKHTKPGMKFGEVSSYAKKLYEKNGLINYVFSTVDPTGLHNIGHTIPFSDKDMDQNSKKILKNFRSWKEVCDLISKNRKFVKMDEGSIINPSVAFTIEPRAILKNHSEFPLIMFHTIALLDGKKKELLTDFEEIFKIAGMKYMIG